jgi:hypothetical protein
MVVGGRGSPDFSIKTIRLNKQRKPVLNRYNVVLGVKGAARVSGIELVTLPINSAVDHSPAAGRELDIYMSNDAGSQLQRILKLTCLSRPRRHQNGKVVEHKIKGEPVMTPPYLPRDYAT